MMKLILAILCCCSLTGCERLRSSLQMSSDSLIPFLGLQLAVDANSPAVQIPKTMINADQQPAEFADAPSYHLTQASANLPSEHSSGQHFSKQQPRRAADFQFTASEAIRTGDLKMALPKFKPKSGSPEAEQLADLLHRLKRS